jgi:hypothetical protein
MFPAWHPFFQLGHHERCFSLLHFSDGVVDPFCGQGIERLPIYPAIFFKLTYLARRVRRTWGSPLKWAGATHSQSSMVVGGEDQ